MNEYTYGQNYFEKIFYNQHGTACAREDSAGNIIVSFPEDSIIMKCDGLANPIWSKSYNFSTHVFEILDNGNWIGGGYKLIDTLLYAHTALLDVNGDTLWTRIPHTSSQKSVHQLKIDQSGNFIFMIFYTDQNVSPFQLMKMDTGGNILASSPAGYGNNFHFNIIHSNLIVAASTQWSPVGPSMFVVEGYNSSLTQVWNETNVDTFGIPHSYEAGIVFPNTITKIIVGGLYDGHMCFFDLNSQGQLNYPPSGGTTIGRFVEVIPTSTGGFLCIGKLWTQKSFVIRYGAFLNTIWYREFQGIQGVDARFAQETNDGGFIISGSTIDSTSNNIPWLIKLDRFGSITTGVNDVKLNNTFHVFQRNNSFEVSQSIGNRLMIYDMNGRLVNSMNNIPAKFSIDFFEKPGIYIFSLYKDTELIETKKIFFQRN